MGSALAIGSAIGSAVSEHEEKIDSETVTQLQNMQRMVKAKLEAITSKLSEEAFEDPRLPILSIVNRAEKYMLKVKSAPNEKIKQCLDSVVGGSYLDGVEKMLSVALGELLGNTGAGEQEKKDFHVVFACSGLLRVDYYMYKYQFESKGLKEKYQNIFCYYIQVGVLDSMKVPPQILLYELTRSVGDPEKLKQATQELKGVATFTQELYDTLGWLQSAADGKLKKLEPSKEKEAEDASDGKLVKPIDIRSEQQN